LKGGDFIKKIVIILVLLFSLSIPTFAMASNSLGLVVNDYDSYGDINLTQDQLDLSVEKAISQGLTTYSVLDVSEKIIYIFTDGSEPFSGLDSEYDKLLRFHYDDGDIYESSAPLSVGTVIDSGYITDTAEPVPDETPGTGEDTNESEENNDMEEGGTTGMFESLTTSAITTEATTWASHFDNLLLVVVGVGIGFACVRFVKHLFF
jgi:hypothetical protein